eukprot:15436937-Alexandrium_andersonii.AAC.1
MAQARTLDVPEAQICIDYFDDENFPWHHRLLLVSGASAGEWVVATPDGEIQLARLSDHRVVALQRHAPFPARVRGQVYAFEDLTPAQVDELRAEARGLAQVLGFAGGQAPPGVVVPRWVIADPAAEGFGSEVDAGLLGDHDRFVSRDAVGLAMISDDEGWVHVENVSASAEDDWKREKRSGPGRDPRVLPTVRASGAKAVRLSDAVAGMRPADVPQWPFRGPKALP